ncbi:SusC/RagA family TonB-linked outer membrane protein [Terrimonas pollutisoli]|uniref:SusC/RagA family TonB-linked outer membrane protein n=1 Tax=Terrimonas pollutisoli TaxID=3034147 RepID=UPI0023EB6CE8|nr:TonB-dependent receptor [Terrimonas sp. H1YJ31]
MLAKLTQLKKAIFSGILLAVMATAFAQQKKVEGKVTGPDGNPVFGATVSVKGTTISTTTATDGSYSITLPANSSVLVVSYVGNQPVELDVSGKSVADVTMQLQSASLDEVVVIGYGTAKRKDLTGSVSSVNAATIEKVPVISATQALQGRASGVQIINNDGAPGGNISVLIRGIGSLASGGNNPLYVIDGYPTTGGINNINPNDIASIDVLKDASATAVYGIRAANGVIIITTKKGLKNRVQVSLDMYEAFQSKPKTYDLLNAQQFATLSNEVETTEPTYHGLPIWHTPNALTTVDWQDALYRTGLTQNYSVAIRGGNEKIQSAVSFGYYNQKGIVLGSFFKRFTVGLNLDYQPVKWLKSSTSVKYGYQDANTPLGTGGLFQLVVNPPTLDSGNRLTNQIKDGKGNYGFYNPINPAVFKFGNPVYDIETRESKNITNYVLANSSLEVTVYDGIKLNTNAGVNVNNFSGSFFLPADNRANTQYPGAIVSKAFYHQNLNNNFEWLWENTIAYDKTFGSHTINFVAGVSAQKNTTNLMGAGGEPPNNVIRDIAQVANLQFDRFGNGRVISSLASQFARLNYQFADKYILTGTIRRDGSSKFPEDNRYGVFPSGAVAWKIKNEGFLQDVSWLDDLKLRGGYGVVGNEQPIGLFRYQALYAGNFAPNVNGGGQDNLGYPFNSVYQNGIAQTQPANPDLEWETDYTTNIGVDAAFMKGALTLTVDWFKRRSKDFLLTIPASPQTGYNFITRNVGEMENKGVEIAVNYRGSKGRDFQYGVGLNLSAIKNRLTDITSGVKNLTSANFGFGLTGQGWGEFSQSVIGGEVGEFYGYRSLGIFQTQAEIDALNAKAPGGIYYRAATKPGDRYFADVSGPEGKPDGKVDANDRVSIGSPQPDLFGGLNLDASYKALDFNLFFYGSFGNEILNYIESHLQSFQKRGSEGVQNVSIEYYQNRWTASNPSNEFSRALANDESTLNNVPSSHWVEKGSYVKLKNLTVGYTLPSSIADRFKISRLRVYVSSQNLFTITKYDGLDPEIGIQGGNPIFNGVDNGVYPSSRFYTVGLNVTF